MLRIYQNKPSISVWELLTGVEKDFLFYFFYDNMNAKK